MPRKAVKNSDKQRVAHWLARRTIDMLNVGVKTINDEHLMPMPIYANHLIDECVRRSLSDVIEHYREQARSNGHLSEPMVKTGKA